MQFAGSDSILTEFLKKTVIIAPVTALCLSTSQKYVYAGIGPSLHVFDVHTGELVNKKRILESGRVHGISVAGPVMLVYGQKLAKVCQLVDLLAFELQGTTSTDSQAEYHPVYSETQIEVAYALPGFEDWIWSAQLLPASLFDGIPLPSPGLDTAGGSSNSGSGAMNTGGGMDRTTSTASFGGVAGASDAMLEHPYVIFALGHNQVQVWDWTNRCMLYALTCQERSTLYSASFYVHAPSHTLMVTAGTVYNQVLIWDAMPRVAQPLSKSSSLPSSSSSDVDDGDDDDEAPLLDESRRPVLFRLEGHDGVIFRLVWCADEPENEDADGLSMLTCSDDRSLRIWTGFSRTQFAEASQPEHERTFYGHVSRVWDCLLLPNRVISVGEDFTCRVWHRATGQQLAMFDGHNAKNVRRLVYVASLDLVIVGVDDSSIHLWQLDTLEQQLANLEMDKKMWQSDSKAHASFLTLPAGQSPRSVELADMHSLYVCSVQGSVWATSIGHEQDLDADSEDSRKWTLLYDEPEHPLLNTALSGDLRWLACTSSRARMAVIDVTTADTQSNNTLARALCWDAHSSNGDIKVAWDVPRAMVCENASVQYKARRERLLQDSTRRMLMTASSSGELRCWLLDLSQQEQEDDGDGDADSAGGLSVSLLGTTIIRAKNNKITSMAVIREHRLLLAGGSRGVLHVFELPPDDSQAESDPSKWDHMDEMPCLQTMTVHGSHPVSAIDVISAVKLRSCGRDGHFNHYRVTKHLLEDEAASASSTTTPSTSSSSSSSSSSSPSSSLAVVCTQRHNNSNKTAFVESVLVSEHGQSLLVGFHSYHFVVWNWSTEEQLLKLFCGGGRRKWAFTAALDPLRYCMAYVRQGKVVLTQQRQPVVQKHQILSNFHSQGCLAVSFFNFWGKPKRKAQYLLTGSPDGTVKMWRYADREFEEAMDGGALLRSSMDCVNTMSGHGAIVCCLVVDQHPNGPFLVFSGGGNSLIKCWQLRKPVFGGDRTPDWTAVYSWHIKNIDAECRVVSITAFSIKTQEQLRMHVVVAGCSDASLCVFGYNDTRTDVQLLAKLEFHTPALCMQHFHPRVPDSDRCLHMVAVGGTDGCVTTFDLTPLVDAYEREQEAMGVPSRGDVVRQMHAHYRSDPPTIFTGDKHAEAKEKSGKAAHKRRTGAWVFDEDHDELWPPLRVIAQVHQSGVNCMAMTPVGDSGREWTLATGGDDQALSVLHIHVQVSGEEDEGEETPVLQVGDRPIRMERAHAAAVNGVALRDGVLFSTGIDQRLLVWRVDEEAQELELLELACAMLEIADISAMAVRKRADHLYAVAVVGAGMEVVEIKLRGMMPN